jgi:release factor glutamine methyltransferase
MLTYNQAFYKLKDQLQQLYDATEAAAICHVFMEYVTGLSKMERLDRKEESFTESQQHVFDNKSKELLKGKPIQYITTGAWFRSNKFFVNENVLIPRPETEELVQWITDEVVSQPNSQLQILDIGTGSGCIPISLKSALPEARVTAIDISYEALAVAQINASEINVAVELIKLDFLNPSQHNKLGSYDVIVSNPPYIPAEEKARLHKNVKDFEPGIALFVPDNDALVFYKAIALFGKTHLNANGCIYCEMDAAHAEECKKLFEGEGYKNVEIKKDMHGNWRMLRAEGKPLP